MSDLDIFRYEYVPNRQGANASYSQWRKSNPNEAAKWDAYRDALIAGGNPVAPVLVTKFGKALIAAGKMAAPETVPPPPPPPPPASGPITISAGGTYIGNWVSPNDSGAANYGAAVAVATAQPVVIQDSIIENTTSTGYCAYSNTSANNITFRRCTFRTPAGGSGRALNTGGSANLVVENCTLTRTTGLYIQGPTVGASILIAKNSVLNIQGGPFNTVFFQVNGATSVASGIVEWNQVVNLYGQSLVEDVISIYGSSGFIVRNNFVHGGYPATPTSGHSGMCCNLGDGSGNNNIAHDNQFVAYTNGGIGLVSGSNNHAYNNRVIADGRLDDGTEMTWSNTGLICYTTIPGNNNTLYNNYVGWMQGTGFGHPIARADYYCPTADNNVETDNTFAYGNHSTPITKADEDAEWTIWQTKLTANGITVGA